METDTTNQGDCEIQHPSLEAERTLLEWLHDYEICVTSLRDSHATSVPVVDPANCYTSQQASALGSDVTAPSERGEA